MGLTLKVWNNNEPLPGTSEPFYPVGGKIGAIRFSRNIIKKGLKETKKWVEGLNPVELDIAQIQQLQEVGFWLSL